MPILPQLIEFWMTRGMRQEQAESLQQQQEMMKLQQKLINMNIKEKQQMLDTISALPENMRSAAMLSPRIAGTLLMLTNRGQQPTETAMPQPGGAIPTRDIATGDIAAPRPSLPSQIAESQLGNIGGILGDVLYKELGIGRSSEIVTTETLQHPETKEMVRVPRTRDGEYRWELAQPAPPEYATQTITKPTGGEEVLLYDKLRGFRPGGISAMPTKPAPMELPIKEDDLPNWVHPQTLGIPIPGTTPNQATQQGYKRISTATAGKLLGLKPGLGVLTQLKNHVIKVFGPREKVETTFGARLKGKVVGGTQRYLGALTQTNPDAAQLMNFGQATLAPWVRSLGDVGNLAEGDIKRARGLVPEPKDTAEIAWLKYEQLLRLQETIIKMLVEGRVQEGEKTALTENQWKYIEQGKSGLSLQPQPKKKIEDPLGLR